MDARIVKFLEGCEVEGNHDYTHTSKIKPMRKYYIIGEKLEEYYDIYNQVVDEGGIVGITEKCAPVVPLIVDIDFRTPLDNGLKRYYKPKHLQGIVQAYQEVIEEIAENPTEKTYYCCLLEKTKPTSYQGRCKDGFHLHFPHFHTEQWVQKDIIRPRVIEKVRERKILDDIPILEKLEKVFDKNVPGVTWLMYGSRKDPKSEPYVLSKIYNQELELINSSLVFKKKSSGTRKYHFPQHFSIRGVDIPTPLKPDYSERQVTQKKKVVREYQREIDEIFADLIVAEQLLEMLDDDRAEDYTPWIEVGWVLYNISEGHDKGLELWDTFSARSAKYQQGVCEKNWSKMEMRGIRLERLEYMARMDSPNEYLAWNDAQITHILQQGISMAHNDIAKILHIMFKNQFVCADVEKGIWYEFDAHRWKKSPGAIHLKRHLSRTLTNKYAKLAAKYMTKLQNEEDEEQRSMWNNKVSQTSKLIEKLKNTSFKKAVLTEAMEYFYDPDFIEKMDENPNLLVCENGVYDAETKTFRSGRPDDYCTKSTGLYYHDFDDDDPRVQELDEIFKKTFVNPKLYKFFRQTASDLIRGGNRHKIFVIWTGQGDNGKSVMADLLELVFGDYYYTPPTTILTGKQQQSSGATAELMPTKGARIVVVSETDNSDVLNCGTMKKLTGGDPFYCRGLFKDPVKITPQFKLILHCNKLPNVSAEDKASWNRIRVLPFESTFVKKHLSPETIKEQFKQKKFPMDKSLKERIPVLAEALLWWLIRDFERFGDADLYQPAEVTCATEIYQKSNDFYLQFMEERLEESESRKDFVSINVVYALFKEWFKDSFPGQKTPSRPQLQEAMDKKLGPRERGVWRGVKLYEEQEFEDIEVEEPKRLAGTA